MKVTMMLADSAEAVGGKLYILGGGWTVIGPEIGPTAIAILFSVPWDQTSVKHRFAMELLDADGDAVTGPDENPLMIEGEFETGRPPGIKPGTSLDVGIAIPVPPLPLELGVGYVWRLTVDQELRDEWRLPFTTNPGQGSPA